MLTCPPLINQETLNDPDRFEACGETCDAMVSQALGHDITAGQIIADIRSKYGDPSGGTTWSENEWILSGEDLSVRGWSANAGANIASALQHDHYTVVLIEDDNNGDPQSRGPYRHFIIVYGLDTSGYQCANPWGGRDITYPNSQLIDAILGGVEVIPPPAGGPMPTDTVILEHLISAVIAQSQALAGQTPFDAEHENYATGSVAAIMAGKITAQDVINPYTLAFLAKGAR